MFLLLMFAFSWFIQGSQLRNSPNPRASSLQRPPSAVSWDPRAWLSAGLPWYLPRFDLDGPSGWRRAGQGRCGSWAKSMAQHGWAWLSYLTLSTNIWVHLITYQSDGWSSFFTGQIDIWGYTAIDVSICLCIHPSICLYSLRVCVLCVGFPTVYLQLEICSLQKHDRKISCYKEHAGHCWWNRIKFISTHSSRNLVDWDLSQNQRNIDAKGIGNTKCLTCLTCFFSILKHWQSPPSISCPGNTSKSAATRLATWCWR